MEDGAKPYTAYVQRIDSTLRIRLYTRTLQANRNGETMQSLGDMLKNGLVDGEAGRLMATTQGLKILTSVQASGVAKNETQANAIIEALKRQGLNPRASSKNPCLVRVGIPNGMMPFALIGKEERLNAVVEIHNVNGEFRMEFMLLVKTANGWAPITLRHLNPNLAVGDINSTNDFAVVGAGAVGQWVVVKQSQKKRAMDLVLSPPEETWGEGSLPAKLKEFEQAIVELIANASA